MKYTDSTYFRNPWAKIENITILNFDTISTILAFHCARVSYRYKGTIKFDSDNVEAMVDSCCSTSFFFELKDFIDYKPMNGKVEELVHNTVETGILKYTVLDNNDDKANMLMKDTIHVPTMNLYLISLQQVSQQSDDPSAGGDVRADACYLRWNSLLKIVPYQSGNTC